MNTGFDSLRPNDNLLTREHLLAISRELQQLEIQEDSKAAMFFDRDKITSSIQDLGKLLPGNLYNLAIGLLIRMSKLGDDKISQAALEAISNNVLDISKQISTDSENSSLSLRAIARLADSSAEEISVKARAVINQKINDLITSINDATDIDRLLPFILKYGNEEQQKTIENIIKDEVDNLSISDIDQGKLGKNKLYLLSSIDEELFAMVVFKIIRDRLKGFGLKIDEMINRWKQSFTGTNWAEIILYNLGVINDLEMQRPGLAKYLNESHNIANFSRYPIEILLDQEFKEDDSRKTASLSVADWDANRLASFMGDNSINLLREFYKVIKERYRIEIFEIGKIDDFDTYLDNPEKEGVEDFAIIHMHGSRNFMSINDGPNGQISALDFLSSENKLGLRRLKTGGVLLLMSCETGYMDESGWSRYLAQKLSIISQGMVIAPAEEAGIKKLMPVFDGDGLIDFDVTYVAGGFDNVPVEARRFVAGSLVLEEKLI